MSITVTVTNSEDASARVSLHRPDRPPAVQDMYAGTTAVFGISEGVRLTVEPIAPIPPPAIDESEEQPQHPPAGT